LRSAYCVYDGGLSGLGGCLVEVTKKAEYAISALIELALHRGEFISSKEIAQRQNIPPNFLPQIMATLGSRGWVEGVRGPGGGVRLLVSPDNITVREVVELIEGPVAITRCLMREANCSQLGRCPLHSTWARAQEALLNVLGDTTLQDVVETQRALDRQTEAEAKFNRAR